MRAPRWALALTAAGTAGVTAAVVSLPGLALADSTAPAIDTRFNLAAIGDAFFFQVDGDEIPASPKNEAGSLTAATESTNSGGSTAFAGAPYYGNTAQTLPGTINGVPNQFGAAELQLPFSELPGYVASGSGSTPTKEEFEGQYYRVKVNSEDPNAATASAFYGAPAALPAPNQQQSANSNVSSTGSKVVAAASGSSSGLVSGPLEIGNSTAIASITQTVGKTAKITSKVFGQFSVAGMAFGFDQNGFKYAGQGMSSKDAIAQANNVLKNANMQIDLAPVEKVTEGDQVTYTIGGLKVTTTQASPSGAGKFTFTYIIGRAKVSAGVADLSFGASDGNTNTSESASTGTSDGTSDGAGSDVSGVAEEQSTESTTSDLDSVISPDLADEAAAVPAVVSEVAEDGAITEVAPEASGEVSPFGDDAATDEALPKTLGFVPAAGETGDGTEWLYAMLLLAGVGVLGGHFLFGRFAAARGA
ncbi:MAG: hypothetical protein ACT4PP_10680 [Sporichthyaceae bacterium]